MKIQIDRALALHTVRTGERLSRTELGRRVMPGSRESYRSTVLKQMAEGESKRPDLQVLTRIAKELDVDMNFLLGWEKKETAHEVDEIKAENE